MVVATIILVFVVITAVLWYCEENLEDFYVNVCDTFILLKVFVLFFFRSS